MLLVQYLKAENVKSALHWKDKNECVFQNICGPYPTTDYCILCEDGYYVDIETHQCVAYDGSKDTTTTSNNVGQNINIQFGLIALLFIIIFQ